LRASSPGNLAPFEKRTCRVRVLMHMHASVSQGSAGVAGDQAESTQPESGDRDQN
jgi:hypothetical protein